MDVNFEKISTQFKVYEFQAKCKHNKKESHGVWIMLKILIFNL